MLDSAPALTPRVVTLCPLHTRGSSLNSAPAVTLPRLLAGAGYWKARPLLHPRYGLNVGTIRRDDLLNVGTTTPQDKC
jgi:hypothetical protein